MKKITFVCKYLGKGGAERVMSILIRNFAERGWDVQLILLNQNIIEYPIPDCVSVRFLDWGVHRSVFQILKRLTELRNAVEGEIVISFLYSAIRDTTFSLMGSGKHVIISDRSDPSREPEGRIRQFIRNVSYYLPKTIVFQTEEAKAFFPRAVQKKGIVIPNPVNSELPDAYQGKREEVVIAAGRLEEQKNFSLLLRAFAKFHEAFPAYILRIYGRGQQEDMLKALARELNIEEFVDFPGFVSDIYDKMNSAAMYVSSSDYEGISNSMLEAMAMGVPTICTDCPVGGARETIKDGENGILVPVGDEEALSAAMKAVASDPVFANRLSENSRRIREELSEKEIAGRWIRLAEGEKGYDQCKKK